MAEYSKEITFWNLLQEKEVIIPIIQRDYAQGRIGQEYLRERFLGKIFDALTDDKGQRLFLDFVYGSTEHGSLFPLDGQQRLTTLWLVHWYMALVSGELTNCKETLKKFSYQTRSSSRRFCEQLCNIDTNYNYESEDSNISAYIRNQRWFYSSYEQDPTILSMLYMLGGTDIDDKDGNDIIDGIEEICRSRYLKKNDISRLFRLITSMDCPIRFFLLNMEDKNMPLTDDLYIKMNARGKVLTDFENFKVDLLDYKLENDIPLIKDEQHEEGSFSHKLDTIWTDLFWCNHSEDYKIDGIMMKFFNRFFLDWYFAKGSIDKKPETVTAESFFKNMTSGVKNYQNISIYSEALTPDAIQGLTQCLDGLYALYQKLGKDLSATNEFFQPYWSKEARKKTDTFYFLPKYEQNGEISSITQQQRVIFHAICMFFSNCSDPEPAKLQAWMHFVWNMVENSYIDREQTIAAIRFFENDLKQLSDKGYSPVNEIIPFLQSIDPSSMPSEIFGRRQLLEEIAKAKQCFDGTQVNYIWKKKIEDAESSLFFKGAIAFLFNNEEGNPCDWKNFDRKLETANLIFDQNGLKNEYCVPIISRLFQLCTNFDSQLWWHKRVFNGMSKTWKNNILIHVDNYYRYVYASNIHHILLNDDYIQEHSDSRIDALSNPSLVQYMLTMNENKRDMYIRWPHSALHFCGERQGILLSHKKRDSIIKELLEDERFKLRYPNVEIKGTDKFWGFDIDLTFNNDGTPINLRWYRESNDNYYDLYVMDENWNWKHWNIAHESERGDRKRCICFNIEEGWSSKDIIEKILENMTLDNTNRE